MITGGFAGASGLTASTCAGWPLVAPLVAGGCDLVATGTGAVFVGGTDCVLVCVPGVVVFVAGALDCGGAALPPWAAAAVAQKTRSTTARVIVRASPASPRRVPLF